MSDLTTLVSLKEWLQIPTATTTDDALLSRLITSASAFMGAWLNRILTSASYTEQYDGNGGSVIQVANFPVTAVASVSVDGVSISASPDSGIVQSGFAFDDRSIWLVGYSFNRGHRNVKITYTAGFSAIPKDLEQACIDLVSLKYKGRDRIGQTSKSLGGETVAIFTTKDMTEDIKTVLNQYKNVLPI